MDEKKQIPEELAALTTRVADLEHMVTTVMNSVTWLVENCPFPDGGSGIVDKRSFTKDSPVMVNLREALVSDGMTFEDADEAIEEWIQSVKAGNPREYIETPKGRVKMETRKV